MLLFIYEVRNGLPAGASLLESKGVTADTFVIIAVIVKAVIFIGGDIPASAALYQSNNADYQRNKSDDRRRYGYNKANNS